MSDDYRDDPWVDAIAALPLIRPDDDRAEAVRRRCRAMLQKRAAPAPAPDKAAVRVSEWRSRERQLQPRLRPPSRFSIRIALRTRQS